MVRPLKSALPGAAQTIFMLSLAHQYFPFV
jgi:hypothetical protein